jgi:hypothetical protein
MVLNDGGERNGVERERGEERKGERERGRGRVSGWVGEVSLH